MIIYENNVFAIINFINGNGEVFPDFVNSGTNFTCSMRETIGNELPIMVLNITLPAEICDIMFNEGLEIGITVGRDENTIQQSIWHIYKAKLKGSVLSAICSLSRSYGNDKSIEVINDTSINALEKICSRYFEFDKKNTSHMIFSDKMKWINPNDTIQNFIDQIWYHSYSSNGILLPGITADGIFKIRDIANPNKYEKKSIGNNLKLSAYSLNNAELAFDSGEIHNQYGILQTTETDYLSGNTRIENTKITPSFGKIFNCHNYKVNQVRQEYINPNMHSKYHDAFSRNVSTFSFLYSGISKQFRVEDLYGIELLDFVDYLEPVAGFLRYSEVKSGTQIVAEVLKEFTPKNLNKSICLLSDSVDSETLQGKLLMTLEKKN